MVNAMSGVIVKEEAMSSDWLELRRGLVRFAVLCLCLLAPALQAVAQTGAAIGGAVTDAQGGALPGVSLTLRNDDTGVTRTTTSDGAGAYRFAALPPGRYDLTAELDSFGASELKDQTLNVGVDVKHDIVMKIQSLQESVTVTAAVPVIETNRSDVSNVVNERQIDTVPVSTRQTLDLALLVPGTNTDNSVPRRVSVQVGAAGAIARNLFLVDGVTNQQSTSGDSRQDFPQDGIQEFRVNVAQATAEFGGTTGGVVSIVTKGGTNQFHGEGFEFFRNKDLNAMNEFEQQAYNLGAPKPSFNQNNNGAYLGGPIIMSRLHFLVATDLTNTDQTITVNTGQPQDYSTVSGIFPNNQYRYMFFSRLDGELTPHETFFARWGWERDDLECQSCGGNLASTAGANVQQRRNSLVMGQDSVLSNSTLNEFRFQWAPFAYLNGPSESSSIWTEVGNFSPDRYPQLTPVYRFPSLTWGTTANKVQIETWWEFHDDFSFITSKGGNHSWKMGVASVRAPNQQDLTGNALGTWTFSTDQLFNPGNPGTIASLQKPTQFTASLPPVAQRLQTNLFQTYVQDAWRPSSNLTVNLGVRYDVEYGSFNQDMNLAAYPKQLPFINPSTRGDHNNIQPRAGFAWSLNQSGSSLLRGAWGFYNAVLYNGSFGTELSNLLQSNIIIRNPSYPNPYGSLSPLQFASTAPPNITIFNDDIRNPFASTETIGFSQKLGKNLAVHVDGVYEHATDGSLTVNINTPNPVSGLRPLPVWGQINQISPLGEEKYKALFLRLDRAYANRMQYLVSYTLASCMDNNTTTTDANNPGADWGPCSTDRRQTLVTSGSIRLPGAFTLGGVWTLRSAMPFSAIAGKDLNNDGNVTDFVPGTTRDQGNRGLDLTLVNQWRAENGLAPISASQIATNRYNSLDVRLSRQFRIGPNKVELLAQVFNILGSDNLLASGGVGGYVTNALSNSFGEILTAGNRQQAELAIRYVW
jgi:Carboxypeptidase regulatory-like domain